MKKNFKWVIALAPLIFMGCSDSIESIIVPLKSGDDVQFAVAKNLGTPQTRTMYEDQWDEKTIQAIYWGNYMSGKNDTVSIYCPDTERGFAKYHVNPLSNSSVAETIVKTGNIGVQWGAQNTAHTFYAFYPANRASESLQGDNKSVIRATLKTGQSPILYKQKANGDDISKLAVIESFKSYIDSQINSSGGVAETTPRTIYGMPDMEAAVMVARKTMAAEEFGNPVPLQFNVLADVLDITINGPITPNTLNGNDLPEGQREAKFIRIQAVTVEVVDLTTGGEAAAADPSKYEIDVDYPISGTFDLDMSAEAQNAGNMVTNVQGDPVIQLQTSQTDAQGGVYYPTLFVRSDNHTNVDKLRLRTFLIPGQITGQTLNRLRIHVQTDCGDYYKMLKNDDSGFVSGQIYPVKLNYFQMAGQTFDLKKWIGQLDPDIYISELSIPGAWHAANTNYQGAHTMKELYNAGVRAFEVHTLNGTIPQEYNNLGTGFNKETAEYYPEHLNESTTEGNVTRGEQQGNLTEGSSTSSTSEIYTSAGIGSRTYTNTETETQTVTAQFEVTQSGTISYKQKPKYSLRLYRTQNVTSTDPNPDSSLSDAVIELSEVMNKDGLIVLEFGMDGQRGVTVPYRNVSVQRERKGVVSVTGTRTRTRTQTGSSTWSISGWSTPEYGEWSNWNDWSSVTWNSTPTPDGEWTTTGSSISYVNTDVNATEAWVVAVQSCLNRLKSYPNNQTKKPYTVYPYEVTRNTTIRDVQGSVIVKVNTNNVENQDTGNENGWEPNTPALFSRWLNAEVPQTINMKWGQPIVPTPLIENSDDDMRWCFSELDNIGSSCDSRKRSIDAMNSIAYGNYLGGRHRTFYETSLGGYLNGSINETNCISVAEILNTYGLEKISNPSRNPCPLGLVFMNYVIPPSDNNKIPSAELIRAIINNNRAFRLHRITDGK